MPDGSERRRHDRIDANLVVRSRALEMSELPLLAAALGKEDPLIPPLNLLKAQGRVSQFTSVNLSVGGFNVSGDLTLDSSTAYKLGSDVVLEFDLLDGKTPVRAVAQVMWLKPDGERHQVGLMFLLIAQDNYLRIQDFVQKHL